MASNHQELFNTRRNIAIVLVRFAGVYMLFRTLISIPPIISLLGMLYNLNIDVTENSIRPSISFNAQLSIILPIVNCVITVFLAYYLLKHGKWLIKFLSKPYRWEM